MQKLTFKMTHFVSFDMTYLVSFSLTLNSVFLFVFALTKYKYRSCPRMQTTLSRRTGRRSFDRHVKLFHVINSPKKKIFLKRSIFLNNQT